MDEKQKTMSESSIDDTESGYKSSESVQNDNLTDNMSDSVAEKASDLAEWVSGPAAENKYDNSASDKYGERIETGSGDDSSGSKFTVGQGMGDTGYTGSGGASRPDFQYQSENNENNENSESNGTEGETSKPRPAETNSQKSKLRKPVAKKWEIKKPEGHDGFCPLLRIYRPRTSMKKKEEIDNLPAKARRYKWVRDPISDQWIHVERIGEEARTAVGRIHDEARAA